MKIMLGYFIRLNGKFNNFLFVTVLLNFLSFKLIHCLVSISIYKNKHILYKSCFLQER